MAMNTLVIAGCIALGANPSFTTGEVETVATGFQFTEGPIWLQTGKLLFSDIPADKIYYADKTIFRDPSGQSNGLTLDREGRLIAAEHQTRRLTRTEEDGAITILADKYEGKRLNSPNDVIVRSDGMIFFTDPPYGLPGGLEGPEAELDFSGVYARSPQGGLKLLIRDFIKPNGLALSPDEQILYIADTEGAHLRAFQLAADGSLDKGSVLCDIPTPDGMKVDVKGNIWCTAGDGVRVISPSGELLQTIAFPQVPANCAFGEEDSQSLYVTARTAVYRIRTAIPGIRPFSK
jgi:gluconolactonase